MPKNGLEIAFSPEGMLILPFAALIDIIGIALVFFGLDDFGITDIIAWIFLGTWSFFRSQIIPAPGAEPIQKIQKQPRKTGASQKSSKAAKWAKRIRWFEFIPYVGALPLWTVSVYLTIKYS